MYYTLRNKLALCIKKLYFYFLNINIELIKFKHKKNHMLKCCLTFIVWIARISKLMLLLKKKYATNKFK